MLFYLDCKQELLREKQQHLERLMRERELERAEVAKVSLQAERAESALAQLRKEATQVCELIIKTKIIRHKKYHLPRLVHN